MIQLEMDTDQHLSAKLKSFEFELPQLKCSGAGKIQRMCVNPECKQSLICNEGQCQECREHLDCPSINLIGVTSKLNLRVRKYQEFIKKAFEIENNFMNQIQKSRNQLTTKFHLGYFQKNYLQTISDIYSGKEGRGVSGKEAKEFYERLRKQNEDTEKKGALLLEDYQVKLKELLPKILDLQSMLFEEFTKEITIDSSIISKEHEKRQEYLKFLRESLQYPKKIELLFRASQNNFSASAFHKNCDNIPDTFTLIKTQFGKTIGGYTHYMWNAVDKGFYGDESQRAFLMSFDLMDKFTALCVQDLIYCHPNHGPTFGGGHDLMISDKCNQYKNSHASFPSCFNTQKEDKYINEQDTYALFTGATQNCKFKVVDYEVFKVVYE